MAKTKKQLEQEVGELTADLQRIQADFVNFKRRSEEDVARSRMNGKSQMVTALLPVIDNLERALSWQPKEGGTWHRRSTSGALVQEIRRSNSG